MRTYIYAAVFTVLALTGSLRADTVHMDGFAYHRDVPVNLYGIDHTLRTGQNLLSLNGGPDQVSYCVDLNHELVSDWIGSLQSVTVLNGGPMVAYLFNTYSSGINTDDTAAGLQLAIWKVLADWPAPPDFSTGNLKVAAGAPGLAEAVADLSTLPSNYSNFPPPVVIYSSDNPHSQHMLIPEPAAMSLLMLGAFASLWRRRIG
jgi:hypothetical protein